MKMTGETLCVDLGCMVSLSFIYHMVIRLNIIGPYIPFIVNKYLYKLQRTKLTFLSTVYVTNNNQNFSTQ